MYVCMYLRMYVYMYIYSDYSDNQKTLEQEDDVQTQVMTFNSPKNMIHSNCAM